MKNLQGWYIFELVKIFMKFVFHLLLCLPICSLGQIAIYNTDLKDSGRHQLLLGIPNNLSVFSQQRVGKLILVSSKSSVENLGNNRFKLFPGQQGIDTIKIYANKKLIFLSPFNIDTIPDPIARVGYFLDTTLSKNQILTNPFLSVLFPGSNYKNNWHVFQFVMIGEKMNGQFLFQEFASSNRFSARQIEYIQRMQTGDKLHFPNTTVGGPDSRLRTLRPFTIILK